VSKLVDQSLSIPCSMISAVPGFIGQTGRPVPEHTVLDGRYSSRFHWTDWSTSPRAYRTQWSVQFPVSLGRLVDQSLSIPCSVVGTVPGFIGQTGRPVPVHTVLRGRYSPQLHWADWSTSPRAYRARWPVQSPDPR